MEPIVEDFDYGILLSATEVRYLHDLVGRQPGDDGFADLYENLSEIRADAARLGI